MKKEILAYSLAAMLALAVTSGLTRAWPRTGVLNGEVTDPSGAVVPGAKVVISSDHWSQTLSANRDGQYVATDLPAGRYEVSVVSDGFTPFDKQNVVVATGQPTEVDPTLDLAVLKQSITVTEDSPVPADQPNEADAVQ